MKPQTKPALKTPPESLTLLPFWLGRAVQSQPLGWFHHTLLCYPPVQDQLCHSVWGREGHSPPCLLLSPLQSSWCCSQLRPSRGLLLCSAFLPEHRNSLCPLPPAQYCPTASELGWLHGESLLPVHTTGVLPNLCALIAPCLSYTETLSKSRASCSV